MRYPQILIKREDEREERVALYYKHYEVTVKEPGRVNRDIVRYDYNNTSFAELMKTYTLMGYIAIEELEE